jgi:hypothetical protein
MRMEGEVRGINTIYSTASLKKYQMTLTKKIVVLEVKQTGS